MSNLLSDHLNDVRAMPPRERHPKIFGTWDELAPGEAIVLVNDHDPVPLYYQFACEHAGGFHWKYLEEGPEVFRVRIAKGDFADPGFAPTARPKHSCSTPRAVSIELVQPRVLDTRPIVAAGETPCQAIDDAVATLIPGQPPVLLVPFEPVPLYAKLGQQGFRHQATGQADGSWRVEFRRP